MNQPNYKSPEFYKILEIVNKVLVEDNLKTISDKDGYIINSIYNVGKYGSTKIWRVTDEQCPQLLTSGIMLKILSALQKYNYNYINDKVITIGCPERHTINTKTGKYMSSIVIMITELSDNILLKDELFRLVNGDKSVLSSCIEKESRMYKRDSDTRDFFTRLEEFAFSLYYEPLLESMTLNKITNLKLQHQVKAVTLEPDNKADFTGIINGKLYNIEGKATKDKISYEEINQLGFYNYINNRLSTNKESLGSFHNAEFVLLVLRNTGEVVCFELNNLQNNWLVGKIDVKGAYKW